MSPEKMRVDKWLWCVRIFKSRTIAADACKAGKVKMNDVPLKPSQLVAVGDVVEVRKNGFNFSFQVLQLLKSRVSAPIAQACYANQTPEEELNKYNDWFIGKGAPERRDRGAGRPTKRERRQIDDFKFNPDLDWDDLD
ncbi:MAG: RNA-binding S4 domain-containing protein [Saprospiraceae bacterium]